MRILFLLFLLFNQNIYAKDNYEFNLNGNYSENIKTLSDGSTFSTILIKGAFIDNLGNYGKYDCNGIREANSDNKLVNLNVLCEILDKDHDKMWLRARRDTDKFGGVGQFAILDATGKHISKIGLTCTYAVTLFEDAIIIKAKCN